MDGSVNDEEGTGLFCLSFLFLGCWDWLGFARSHGGPRRDLKAGSSLVTDDLALLCEFGEEPHSGVKVLVWDTGSPGKRAIGWEIP